MPDAGRQRDGQGAGSMRAASPITRHRPAHRGAPAGADRRSCRRRSWASSRSARATGRSGSGGRTASGPARAAALTDKPSRIAARPRGPRPRPRRRRRAIAGAGESERLGRAGGAGAARRHGSDRRAGSAPPTEHDGDRTSRPWASSSPGPRAASGTRVRAGDSLGAVERARRPAGHRSRRRTGSSARRSSRRGRPSSTARTSSASRLDRRTPARRRGAD